MQATRDLDRGRTTQEAVDEQVERDLAELVSVQQDAGLDLLADGMLRWQDVFRPFVEAADGLETGALTRFLDTNTFYRAPSATTATPKLGGPIGDRYIAPLPGPRLVTLPSPFALAQWHGADAAARSRRAFSSRRSTRSTRSSSSSRSRISHARSSPSWMASARRSRR